jgi:hypothetical protein
MASTWWVAVHDSHLRMDDRAADTQHAEMMGRGSKKTVTDSVQ